MSEYHVSCGMFGIYAGTVKKNGTEWKDKTRVTDEAIEAVRDWLLSGTQFNNKTSNGYSWTTKEGNTVTLKVSIEGKEQTE
jgi:hypothetical protein